MIGILAEASTTTVSVTGTWLPVSVMGGLILAMFGWLKLDIRDVARRLEALERDYRTTDKAVARIEGQMEVDLARSGRWKEQP